MNNTNKYHLEELKGSDYQIIDDEPNIQGWTIRDVSGKKVGKVRDMLFDTERLTVRYIISDLKDNELNLEAREVLLPLGRVALDTENKDVVLQRIQNVYLENSPGYAYGELNADYETGIYGLYRDDSTLPLEPYDRSTFYDNDNFNNEYYSSKK